MPCNLHPWEGKSLSFYPTSKEDTETQGLPLAPSFAIHIRAFGLSPVNSALKLLYIHYFSPSPLSPLQVKPESPHLDHYSIC